MITRPVHQRKMAPVPVRNPIVDLRTGLVGRFRPPPPAVPIDPTNPATANR